MKRIKRHKVKREMPETSTSHSRGREEHDLAYYIHDRVELMHQVFSVIKYKELKAMAPACIRNISIDDLQELCTEELLGISSKRLCAILDGAEPPSDTESSSQSPTEQLETISLDSISSDEELLSQGDKSKKKKHRHRRRTQKRGEEEGVEEKTEDRSRASRAGLTVLELLELQARARAIRAQLHQEHAKTVKENAEAESSHVPSSGDEVEIKEEPAEVVEISSDEEKPKINQLEMNKLSSEDQVNSKTITKHVNDLIITVPKQKTQKIKLNRSKSVQQTTSNIENKDEKVKDKTENSNIENTKEKPKVQPKDSIKKDKGKRKKKKRVSNASDNDEITLQLSDTEKMDLLEDLDRKSYEKVSSNSSSDSESDDDSNKKPAQQEIDTNTDINKDKSRMDDKNSKVAPKIVILENKIINPSNSFTKANDTEYDNTQTKSQVAENQHDSAIDDQTIENNKSHIHSNNKASDKNDEAVKDDASKTTDKVEQFSKKDIETVTGQNTAEQSDLEGKMLPVDISKADSDKKQMSEGELSDRDSSEVEACDLKPEVVCISDEDLSKNKKKKKKKDKKSKKEKRKKKDIENDGENSQTTINDCKEISSKAVETVTLGQNIVKESEIALENKQEDLTNIQHSNSEKLHSTQEDNKNINKPSTDVEQSGIEDSSNDIVEISDEVYELSDDSSNEYELETRNVLSQEPTASEIEALSAKIDEIEKREYIAEGELKEDCKEHNEEEVSWKDRYLDSKKVKRVLNTSNILNALRKKNRQIKRSLEESKKSQQEVESVVEEREDLEKDKVLEGSIEQYNTLEGLNKFVDPVKDIPINDTLKKDAKQLLKMYKKLLKYNDMNRKKDPSKKKKKKKKSKKAKDNDGEKT